MDVNKLIADLWKAVCNLQGEIRVIQTGGTFWGVSGNLGITPEYFLGTIDAGPIVFKTDSTERMRLTETGNFGIKTPSPTVDLDLNGILRIRGGSPGVGKILQSDADGVASWVTPAVGAVYTADNGLHMVGNTSKLGGLLLENTTIDNGSVVGRNIVLTGQVANTNNNWTDAYLQAITTNNGPSIGVKSDFDGIYITALNRGINIQGPGTAGILISNSIATGIIINASTGMNVTSTATGISVNSTGNGVNIISTATGISVAGTVQGVNISTGGGTTTSNNSALIATNTNATVTTGLIVKSDSSGSISGQASPLDVLTIRRNNGASVAIPIGAGLNFKMQMQTSSNLREVFRIATIATNVGGTQSNTEFWGVNTISVKQLTILFTGQMQFHEYKPSQLFDGGTRLLTIDPTDGKVYTQAIPALSSATVNAANKGLTLNGITTVQLGQDFGAVGNPALISDIREIPITVGTGSIILTAPSQPLFSQTFTANSHNIQGTTAASPTFQMLNADNGSTLGVTYNSGAGYYSLVATDAILIGPSIGVGSITTPTARLHLPAGTATAGTAQFKLNDSVLLTVPEDGAMEKTSAHLYITLGATRYQLDQQTFDQVMTAGDDLNNTYTTNFSSTNKWILNGAPGILAGVLEVNSTGTTAAGIKATSVSGYGIQSSGGSGGVYGTSPTGPGLEAQTYDNPNFNAPIVATNYGRTVDINTTIGGIDLVRNTVSGTPANGSGLNIRFWLMNNDGTGTAIRATVDAVTTTATPASYAADLVFKTTTGGTLANAMLIKGSGQIIGSKYGIGTFTGTAAYNLQVTSAGNIIEQSASLTPVISTGVAAPATTPGKVGDLFIDTTNLKLYFATGTASSADWIIAN